MKQSLHRLAEDPETIGELLARLVEDAKAFVHAEIGYYQLMATTRIAGLKVAAALIVFALFLVQASLTTLLIGSGLAIARLFERLGTAGGVVIAAVIGLLISGLLVRVAIGQIAASARAAAGTAK